MSTSVQFVFHFPLVEVSFLFIVLDFLCCEGKIKIEIVHAEIISATCQNKGEVLPQAQLNKKRGKIPREREERRWVIRPRVTIVLRSTIYA